MSGKQDDEQRRKDADLEQELRRQRKFSLGEAIARQGGSTFKGTQAVPAHRQAQTVISQFIRAHLKDTSGALKRHLEVRVTENTSLVGEHVKAPLKALRIEVERILERDARLHEFTRQVDQRYGQMYDVRPHFHTPGQDPHPDDEYTHDSVRAALEGLLARIDAA